MTFRVAFDNDCGGKRIEFSFNLIKHIEIDNKIHNLITYILFLYVRNTVE